MKTISYRIHYDYYDSIGDLSAADAALLKAAQDITANAYAPYSRFKVGAAARLSNEKLVTGTNQENASFPAGICAERVLLSAASSQYPGIPLDTIALSYESEVSKSDHPISPCGICRQSLAEQEIRQNSPIRLIMGGQSGPIYIVSSVTDLLPLSFNGNELNKE